MRIGDLDGLDVLYDKIGRPIYHEGERLIGERNAKVLALFEGKRTKGQPLVHHGQGDVLVVLTDRRILVFVDPSLESARRVLALPGDESWTRGKELFKVIQGRGRYYVELEWSEVPNVKRPSLKKETATVQIRPEDAGVAVLLMDRETAVWFENGWRDSAGRG